MQVVPVGMEERYEIRGKIGQGGFGAVYRAYDRNLSREVAIKRILPEACDDRESEATRQLTKEAGALSSLQHPHIVTIYDVGIDKDGPFVVMELLHGLAIDAVVERSVFTWQDFREFALQTQEALIAAQDLNLVHRDIKPSNVMLTWLPSGKFQVKIVDFGLAKFTPKPSLQTIDVKDSIFGSIFFMAPEQFERVELDSRTDMYSIGCVYYYVLTGNHPFDGDTGPQVMVSHLDHRVFPLHEMRPDIPRWVTDWIMWHINRLPEHRPNRARDALALFIQNDQLGDFTPGLPSDDGQSISPTPVTAALLKRTPQPILPPDSFGRPNIHTAPQPPMELAEELEPAPNAPLPAEITSPPEPIADASMDPPTSIPAPPVFIAPGSNQVSLTAPKPRLLIPGAASTEAAPATPSPEPPIALVPTPKSAPVVIPAALTPQITPRTAPVITTPVAVATPVITPRAPSAPPIVPVTSAHQVSGPPISHPRPVPTSRIAPGAPQTGPLQTKTPAMLPNNRPGLATAPSSHTESIPDNAAIPQKKSRLTNSAKVTLATVLGIIVFFVAWILISNLGQGKVNKRYNELISIAAMANTKELPVTAADLDILLEAATSISAVTGRETIYKALFIAESADGTNVDAKILKFVTTVNMVEDTRVNLLRRVIGGRIARGKKDELTATVLIDFIGSNPKPESAAAAIDALKGMASDTHMSALLNTLQFTDQPEVRKSCENIITTIIKQSRNRSSHDSSVESAFASATTPELKQSLLRVLGSTGSNKAKQIILSNLKGTDKTMQIAAADAAKNWPDESLIEPLLNSLDEVSDPLLRNRIFQSCREFMLLDSPRSAEKTEMLWKLLAASAKMEAEQEAVIRSLTTNSNVNKTAWVITIIKQFEKTSKNDRIIDLAGKALDRLESLSGSEDKKK